MIESRLIELPLLENGGQRTVCLSCRARQRIDGKYYCDQSKLTNSKRPFECPLPKVAASSSINPYDLLRRQLHK